MGQERRFPHVRCCVRYPRFRTSARRPMECCGQSFKHHRGNLCRGSPQGAKQKTADQCVHVTSLSKEIGSSQMCRSKTLRRVSTLMQEAAEPGDSATCDPTLIPGLPREQSTWCSVTGRTRPG